MESRYGGLCFANPPTCYVLKNPNLGRPDFKFSYSYPKELDEPFAILEHLPFDPLPKPPKPKS